MLCFIKPDLIINLQEVIVESLGYPICWGWQRLITVEISWRWNSENKTYFAACYNVTMQFYLQNEEIEIDFKSWRRLLQFHGILSLLLTIICYEENEE